MTTDASIIEIWTDGSVSKKNIRDSRGTGKYGSVAMQSDELLWEKARMENDLTNNEAEMKAIIDALADIVPCIRVRISFSGKKPSMIIIYSDSQDAVSWIDGQFTCKAPNIKPLLASIRERASILSRMDIPVSIKKIPRERNKAHDVVERAGTP